MSDLNDVLGAIANPGSTLGEALAFNDVKNPFVHYLVENMLEHSGNPLAPKPSEELSTALNVLDIGLSALQKIGPQALITSVMSAGMAAGKVQSLHKDFIEDMSENNVPGFSKTHHQYKRKKY